MWNWTCVIRVKSSRCFHLTRWDDDDDVKSQKVLIIQLLQKQPLDHRSQLPDSGSKTVIQTGAEDSAGSHLVWWNRSSGWKQKLTITVHLVFPEPPNTWMKTKSPNQRTTQDNRKLSPGFTVNNEDGSTTSWWWRHNTNCCFFSQHDEDRVS